MKPNTGGDIHRRSKPRAPYCASSNILAKRWRSAARDLPEGSFGILLDVWIDVTQHLRSELGEQGLISRVIDDACPLGVELGDLRIPCLAQIVSGLGFVEVGYSVTQVPDTERFAEDSEKGDLLVTELLRTAESNMAC